MPGAPTNLSVTRNGTQNDLSWTNGESYTSIWVWRQVTPGRDWEQYSWIENGTATSYSDPAANDYENAVYAYKLVAYTFTEILESAEFYTGYFLDTVIDEVKAITQTPGEVVGLSDTITDIVTALTGTSEQIGMSDTITDIVSVSTSDQGAASVKTDFGYYWGTSNGYIYTYSATYKSDNGASILSMWRSKTVDFSELNIKFANQYKTVYRVSLQYVDLDANTPVSVSISTNGGSTWTSSTTVNIGTGLLNVANKDFWFTGVCGQFFDFKVEFPSTDKTFQLISMFIDFEPWGEVVSS